MKWFLKRPAAAEYDLPVRINQPNMQSKGAELAGSKVRDSFSSRAGLSAGDGDLFMVTSSRFRRFGMRAAGDGAVLRASDVSVTPAARSDSDLHQEDLGVADPVESHAGNGRCGSQVSRRSGRALAHLCFTQRRHSTNCAAAPAGTCAGRIRQDRAARAAGRSLQAG